MHYRFFLFIEELKALLRAVRALVKLSGERLNGKNGRVFRNKDLFAVQCVYRRLGENSPAALFKSLVRDILYIVPDEDPYVFDLLYSQKALYVFLKLLRRNGKRLLLFDVYASYTVHPLLSFRSKKHVETTAAQVFVRTARKICAAPSADPASLTQGQTGIPLRSSILMTYPVTFVTVQTASKPEAFVSGQ